MTEFALLAWLGWACPGGFLAGLWPAAVKPVACRPQPELRRYATVAEAVRAAENLGPGAAPIVWRCSEGACVPVRLAWKTTMEVNQEDLR